MSSNKRDNITDEPKPLFYERQPEEPPRAFEAFRVYRDQGPMRSLRKAAAEFYKGGAETQAEPWQHTEFFRWSRRWMWVARAESWDAHLDEIRRRAREAHVVEHLERARKTGLLIHALGVQALRMHEGSAEPPLHVAKIVALGLELERKALGLPDTFVMEGRADTTDPDAFRARETLRRAREALR